jgi:hypothetical protein
MHTYKPTLVVMYGVSEKRHWEAIAEQHFPPDNILTVGSTIMACAPHPTSHGKGNAYWINLGEHLQRRNQPLSVHD